MLFRSIFVQEVGVGVLWVGALWVVVVTTVVDCECTGAGLTKFDLVSRGWCPSGMKGAFAVTGLSDWVWVGCLV